MSALHHRFDGPEDAPVLVCSNSIGTTLELWERQLPAFAGPFRMLRYDQLGPRPLGGPSRPVHGRAARAASCWRSSTSSAWSAFSFCGLSLGGAVGMWLGANAGDRVDRLVLAGTSAYFGPPERWIERAEIGARRGHGAARRRDHGPLVHPGVRGHRRIPRSGSCRRRRRATPPAATRFATGISAAGSARCRRRRSCSSARRTRRRRPTRHG